MNKESEINQERAKQEALATLGIYALEMNDLESIMNRAIDLSCIIMKLDCAVIFSLDRDEGTFKIGAQAGCAESEGPISAEDTWDIGYALASADPIIVNNYNDDERFSISPFLQDENIMSSVNIVVKGTDDKYGLLGFYTHQIREFTDHEINFLQVVANMVGMAIERDRNKKELRKNNRRLKDEMTRSKNFQREILNNSVAQRWELGSYLHDNLAQMLASAQIILDDVGTKIKGSTIDVDKEIKQLKKIISEGLSGIRDLSHDIIPIDIEEEGVAHAFRFLMQQTQKLYDVNCSLETEGVINEIKNLELATNLYHIIQEAVKNAAIHGQAKNVIISITKPNGDLKLQIKDDGIGYEQSMHEGNGRGIRIMEYRMELLGGTFDIQERDDGTLGTVVNCSIPLKYLTKKNS